MNELIIFGVSVIGGLIIGYAIHKLLKIGLVITGAILFLFIVLIGFGWIDPDLDKITADATTLVNNANLYPQLTNFTNQFSIFVLAGLTIGGVVGFVKAG